ncbi:pentatricopeptide repeat-containing protein [Tripterygium wilfordii]|uniref:Pentatricopeptide repeat-containing protein n=1 Tax=Tripterygium wilfordii TaxID=458696 RepID=A0A7J7C2I0_TRIWF|nr:pentatricopeptide repeat-containing protein At4g21705, mitochondrial-like [Tripterygium wilfordii]KAF5728318.1 pentatricopeptide repeat-containing protein [Tripterygium wilfordii]
MASSIFYTILRRAYHTRSRDVNRHNLFRRISPLGDPDNNVASVLDQWVEEGGKVKELELQRIIRDLRSRKRFTHALQVSEWMNSKGHFSFSPAEHAVHLDLIGKTRGLESAESYFNNLADQDKTEKTYGALLNCYVREGLVDKSLFHVETMKALGFGSTALTYNDLLCLYANIGQLEKIPDVFAEMKANGVNPDNFSYRVCINSYGQRSDLKSMEMVLEEMESQPYITMEWITYSMVSNFYIKAGLKEKALICLKKCEEKVGKNGLGYNHLISLYASLGSKNQIMRLWDLSKSKRKKQPKLNKDYITILGSLVKLGELEEAEKLLMEWEVSCHRYDFRVPNILLIAYCQKGLIEKAEAMLRCIVGKGKTPTPDSWSIVAAGYLGKPDMKKAFECMKEALSIQSENKGWRPKPTIISSILSWLGDNGSIEEVEAFASSFETKMLKSKEMYHALIKAHIRFGKEVDGLLKKMKADEIPDDDETKAILSSRQQNNPNPNTGDDA